ncbi:CZB domain-containing protein [Hydrogenophaga sp. PAMC20947]|uniref:CZB domain-containing protein n=1 Tax=Hydrogenophaga sp. PAMC20947 TaxID=2565558 RepID=UPI00109E1ED2|nr:CZB domain-containing protein [Hydrogenophaga sp. PAMC20947]QCB47346.1 hypothetical protein E5678_15745 [Hydrogenophaga sp. PAMC20947]
MGTTPGRRPLLDRLEQQTAVIHHLEWCVLFNDHLSVDAQEASHLPPLPSASDSELGRWLSRMSQGSAQGDPRFEELALENDRFHQLARQAIDLAHQGRMDLASTLLNTDFERSRSRVLELLRQLRKTDP